MMTTSSSSDRHGLVLSASLAGRSHLASGRPNQDSAGVWQIGGLPPEFGGAASSMRSHTDLEPLLVALASDRATALAVADGHGSERYDRSAIGSALAVTLSLAYCGQILPRFLRGDLDKVWLKNELPRRLAQQWKRLVLSEYPAPSEPRAEPEPEFVARHGTTLLGALVGTAAVLVYQIGDGDSVIMTASGEVQRLVPPRRRLLGTETESLGQPDADTVFLVAVVPVPRDQVRLVMLATDGIANSFADDAGFEKLVVDLLDRLSSPAIGDYEPSELLHRTMARCSSYSGDDVSIAVLTNPKLTNPKLTNPYRPTREAVGSA